MPLPRIERGFLGGSRFSINFRNVRQADTFS